MFCRKTFHEPSDDDELDIQNEDDYYEPGQIGNLQQSSSDDDF